MQTPTHLLVAATALARPGERQRNFAVLAGALLPDLSIYILFVWSKIMAIPETQVWNTIYWQAPWQTLSAISNSFPLWAVVLILGYVARIKCLWICAVAALIHLALDFPVHNSDAHKHFWPLTDWRFHSPVSYWDATHHGTFVSAVEIAIALGCIFILWRRFTFVYVRFALLVALVTFAAVPLYFHFALA